MFFTGLGTAAPPDRYSQSDCWEAFCGSPQFPALAVRSRALLRKVLLGESGVSSRHLALAKFPEGFELTPDVLNARFARHAPVLAARSAEAALQRAGTASGEIDALLVTTCTGYLCPGLTSYVAERLGLRDDVLALDLVGQGCGAAVPNLRTAHALLSSGGCRKVLSICVEVCSAAFFLDDDPGVLISACLFGDGAAAAVLSSSPGSGPRRVEWLVAESLHSPTERECLRFESRGGMLRNILGIEVPAVAARHAGTLLDRALARRGLSRSGVTGWILHPGGRNVLRALQNALGLSAADLRWSAAILREYGNVSSPSVLFALEAALAGAAAGGCWWMASFGAGFSAHGALLRVE